MIDDEVRFKLLKLLSENPEVSQRTLARELGISLGKLNYCLNALIAKGFVKAANFRNSSDKAAYAYLLTPKGIEEKAGTTVRFLKRKLAEHAQLASEIRELRQAVKEMRDERA